MKLLLVAAAVAAVALATPIDIKAEAAKLTGQELVDYVNAKGTTWSAKLGTRFAGMPLAAKKRIIGGVKSDIKSMGRLLDKHRVDHSKLDVAIPDSFDARTNWPDCPSIGYVRDQSACGSCWAFGAAEAMSDRICIASGSKTKVEISAADLMSCCGWSCGFGCEGGFPIEAWRYWVKSGLVTGSNYKDNAGCKPYPFPECEHHVAPNHYNACQAADYDTPSCTKKCANGNYTTAYAADKFYGKSAYGVGPKVADIQKEILTNGPIEASYDVYEDFEHYSGGVYQHTGGEYLGGHAVRVLGWGVDNGTPYWLVANSWNEDWGEAGYFRIIRGKNECGFEEGMVAGLPKV